MAIQDPGSLAKEVAAHEKECKKWFEQADKLANLHEKSWGQFTMINSALWEGAKEIERLIKELADARDAFEKMSTKVEALRKDITNNGKLARDMMAQIKKPLPDIEQSGKDVETLLKTNKGSSLLKDADKTCKALTRDIEKYRVMLQGNAQDCEEPPKSPTMPK
ncbi:MAG: hypothetical protein AB7I01_14135 [Gammaproteobacteria bacterium]